MIRARIQIGDGEVEDTYKAHGLIYKKSDHRTEAPTKERDASSYAEEAGGHTDPRTVQDGFDYTAEFIIDAQNRNLQNVNAVIAAFNKRLYTQETGSDIRTYKEVTLYNDYKRVKIVGLPNPIAELEELKRSKRGFDFGLAKLTIHVDNPTKCEFDLKGYISGVWADGTTSDQWYCYINGEKISLADATYGNRFDGYVGENVVNATNLFNHSKPLPDGMKLPLLRRVDDLPPMGNATAFHFAFGNQTMLEYVPEVDMASAVNAEYMFLECRRLKEIKVKNTGNVKLWKQFSNNASTVERVGTLDFSSAEEVGEYTFPNSNECRYMLIKNLGKGSCAEYVIRTPNWGSGGGENLKSLVDSLLTYSYDRKTNLPMSLPVPIKLAPGVLARLRTDQRAAIEGKGYKLSALETNMLSDD